MNSFPLKIVTPDGIHFEGQAELLTVRTTSGDMGIMAGHVNCVAPLGMGRATIVTEGKKRYAACIGGILSVMNGEVTLVPTTFEWAEEIDTDRADNAAARARKVQRFLSQPFSVAEQFTGYEGKYVPLKETIRGFREIIEGKHDNIPESFFLFAGSIDEVVEKFRGGEGA